MKESDKELITLLTSVSSYSLPHQVLSVQDICKILRDLLERVDILESKVEESQPKQINIPWEVISKEWKYFAKDEAGGMYLYSDIPKLNNNLKVWCGPNFSKVDCLDIDTSGVSWEDTLTKRPEEE